MSDYISRDAILNSASVLVVYDANEDIVNYGVSFDTIRALPAADVAPVRHGRWIDGTCSECHFDAMYYSNSSTQAYTRCCPHCGAMMDGKESR